MELCESVSPREDSLFLTVSEMTGTHGFSHSSSAFGAVVHERWTASLKLYPSRYLHKEVSGHCLKALLIWQDRE